jgi:hypothetical protein
MPLVFGVLPQPRKSKLAPHLVEIQAAREKGISWELIQGAVQGEGIVMSIKNIIKYCRRASGDAKWAKKKWTHKARVKTMPTPMISVPAAPSVSVPPATPEPVQVPAPLVLLQPAAQAAEAPAKVAPVITPVAVVPAAGQVPLGPYIPPSERARLAREKKARDAEAKAAKDKEYEGMRIKPGDVTLEQILGIKK